MTDADKPAFLQALGRLAVGLREKEPDVVQMRVYFDALRVYEIELVSAAAARLMTGTWFPKAPEWLAMTAKIEAERLDEQRAVLRNLREPLCLACGDTGFARDEATNRVSRCACRELRRLEILGRRPMPALPAHEPESDATQLPKAEAMAATTVKGMR